MLNISHNEAYITRDSLHLTEIICIHGWVSHEKLW